MPIAYIRGTPVCFTSQRIDGKRVTTYRGCGDFAIFSELLWREEVEERAELRRARREAWLEFENRLAKLATELRSRYLANRRGVVEAVERVGFRYHRSSEFRLRRRTIMNELATAIPVETPAPALDFETFKRGDRDKFPTLKAFDAGFTWRVVDPAFFDKARDHLFVLVSSAIAEYGSTIIESKDSDGFELKVIATAIKAAELAGAYPNPTVKLAAEAAALAWLEATTLEAAFMKLSDSLAWRDQDGITNDELDRRAADRLGRLADRAFRRFNQSMRLLADVQRATARVTVRSVARSNGVETVTATHAEIRP